MIVRYAALVIVLGFSLLFLIKGCSSNRFVTTRYAISQDTRWEGMQLMKKDSSLSGFNRDLLSRTFGSQAIPCFRPLFFLWPRPRYLHCSFRRMEFKNTKNYRNSTTLSPFNDLRKRFDDTTKILSTTAHCFIGFKRGQNRWSSLSCDP